MNKPKVTVFSPGSAWGGYQHALACYEEGILKEYITSLYYKPNSFPYSLMQYLPSNLADKLKQQAIRRYVDGLDESFVKTYPFYEFLYLIFRRIDKSLALKIMGQRDYLLNKKVGKLLNPKETNILLTFDMGFTYSFEEAKRKGIKCVLEQRNSHFETAEMIFSEEAQLTPNFVSTMNCSFSNKEALKRQIELADYILVPSSFAHRTFLDAGVNPKKLVKIPYGVDINKFTPKVNNKDDEIFRILFVGRIEQGKGIKYLLEAFKQLSLPNSELILVGNIVGDKKALAPYEGYFKHISHMPHNELPEYYSKCDIFVFPSLSEGFGLVILEAMASGTPVIASENTGAGDVIREGIDGFVVPIRDVGALKEKILLLYENEDLLYAMGKNAREQSEKYTWQTYRYKIRKFLNEIL